jgi:hypothetical protein
MAFTYTGETVDLGGGRGWLDRPAAESIFRIDRQIGHLLQITDAGRTWGQQNIEFQHYLRYGSPIALDPDAPSIHQKGNAIDTNEGQDIIGVLEDHGWRRTVYRWVNGVWTLIESWHFEHFTELDNHLNETGDDMSVQDIFDARDGDGRNTLDLGRQTRSDIAALDAKLTAVLQQLPGNVWSYPIVAQDDKGMPITANGKPVTYAASGYLASGNALSHAIRDAGTGTVDVKALADQLRGTLGPELVKALAEALAPKA